jgi:hypothetical protein
VIDRGEKCPNQDTFVNANVYFYIRSLFRHLIGSRSGTETVTVSILWDEVTGFVTVIVVHSVVLGFCQLVDLSIVQLFWCSVFSIISVFSLRI